MYLLIDSCQYKVSADQYTRVYQVKSSPSLANEICVVNTYPLEMKGVT